MTAAHLNRGLPRQRWSSRAALLRVVTPVVVSAASLVPAVSFALGLPARTSLSGQEAGRQEQGGSSRFSIYHFPFLICIAFPSVHLR